MGEEEDVAKALAFLRKHDVSHTGAPVQNVQVAQSLDDWRSSFDIEDLNRVDDPDVKSAGLEPVGPNWKKPGNFAQLPTLANHPDNAWLMHERQAQTGKYKPWLFFSKKTGEYFRVNDKGNGYEPTACPHNPWAAPIIVRAGNASVLSAGATKLDMSVLLPDLQRTGFLLKQPLEFLDTPASLFVLCSGLRNTTLAAEFCAKRFHSAVLPKLSARASVWYDYELIDLLTEATKGLDKQLLESSACFAGSSLAVVLLIGCRLVVATLGSARCLLCQPRMQEEASQVKKPGQASDPPMPWAAKPVAGCGTHTLANKDESLRVETEAAGLGGVPQDGTEDCGLYGRSALPSSIASIKDEWEREHTRVARAMNSFAVLGMSSKDIQEGAASIRKSFRRRSLIVHPDKVTEERKAKTTALFSRLEAACEAVESMLEIDATATVLLADIHCAHDEGRLAADATVAIKLLGVSEGCTAAQASKAAKEKFHAPLSKLQNTARQDVERALKILGVAEESAVRGTQLWLPAEADVGMHVTRALGCKDLKSPVKLLSSELSVEIIMLGCNEISGLALVTEGAERLTDPMVARRMAEHAPGRPRAAALRIATDGAKLAADSTDGKRKRGITTAVCAYFRGESAGDTFGSGANPAKRLKTGLPERVRVSHVLLRWAGLKGGDEFERPGMKPPTRTQAQAELELLNLAEGLLMAREPKTLGARFKAMVLKHSECNTALNVPHADLGWLDPGGAEPPFEVAAFDTPLGGLSDVVVTSRGAHLMYRLG